MKNRWILFIVTLWAICTLAACGKAEGQTEGKADGQAELQAEEQISDSGQTDSQAGTQAEGETQTQDSAEIEPQENGQAKDSAQTEAAADGQAQDEEKDQDSAYTFTDDLGRQVTVESQERVAALLGSYADMWVLAGGQVCAAPDDAFVDFDLPLAEDTVNLGETKNLSLELLLSANPDFVLASTNTKQHLEWQQSLEAAGITVAYFDVACFEDYLRMLEICTDITGQTECYTKYGTDIQEKINDIVDRNKEKTAPTVLYMRASATSIRAKGNSGNVLGEMLESFDCTNIADSDESLLENLSLESILLMNPDQILIVQSGDDLEGTQENIDNMFRENPLWNELDAVKNGQVHVLDKHLYNLKPNARWAEAYEELERILYP